MGSTDAVKTIIQCDFDGTITEEDQAFLLLDAFARGNWRQLLTDYREGKISVGNFNTSVGKPCLCRKYFDVLYSDICQNCIYIKIQPITYDGKLDPLPSAISH